MSNKLLIDSSSHLDCYLPVIQPGLKSGRYELEEDQGARFLVLELASYRRNSPISTTSARA